MVIFQTPEGSPGYHQTTELEAAVAFVEGLRNEQNVEHARIFRMEEVPFEFRGYYRVELHRNGSNSHHPLRRMDLVDEAKASRLDLRESLAMSEEPADGEEYEYVEYIEYVDDDSEELEGDEEAVEGAVDERPYENTLTGSAWTRKGLFGR
jgi:hypothetical protein